MRMFKLIPLLSMIVLSGNVFAATFSSVIPLIGGEATHNKFVIVKLNKLLTNVVYDVYCDITSNHVSGQKYDDIQIWAGGSPGLTLNGQLISDWNGQMTMPANRVNKLEAVNASTNNYQLAIRNLDDTDTITVSNCYAKPITNG